MFRRAAQRLLRESWQSVSMAVEEIYQVFQTEGEIEHQGTLVLEKNGDAPAITLRGFSSGDTVISIKGSDGSDLGDLVFGSDGLTLSGGTTTTTVVTASGTNNYIAKTVSGSGDTYLVDIYPDGPSGSAVRVTATQLSIASGKSLPLDKWIPGGVTKIGNEYYMQWPVW